MSPPPAPDAAASTELLRHHLAALALRLQHALRGAPEGFGAFEAGHDVRTPRALVVHIAQVLTLGSRLLEADDAAAGPAARTATAATLAPDAPWDDAVAAVHAALERLDARFRDPAFAPDRDVLLRVLHGPMVDAATHVGQLVLLRRLAGAPVAPASHLQADVRAGRIGPKQPTPPAPHDRTGGARR